MHGECAAPGVLPSVLCVLRAMCASTHVRSGMFSLDGVLRGVRCAGLCYDHACSQHRVLLQPLSIGYSNVQDCRTEHRGD